MDEAVPACGIPKDLLEQVGSSGDRLGDAEEVGMLAAPLERKGIAAHLGVEEVRGVALPAQGELVEALDLSVGQDVLGGVAAAVVAPVDLVRRGRAGRDGHQQVALAGVGAWDCLDAHV